MFVMSLDKTFITSYFVRMGYVFPGGWFFESRCAKWEFPPPALSPCDPAERVFVFLRPRVFFGLVLPSPGAAYGFCVLLNPGRILYPGCHDCCGVLRVFLPERFSCLCYS